MAAITLATNPEARAVIDRSAMKKSTLLGATLFVTAALLYVLTFSVLLLSHDWWWKACCAPVLGFSISVLFVIAHDACHGSLTPIQWLNKLLGRLGFLASFHPYAAWEWTHNAKHHGFTNVRGEDIVYVPFSPDEFARLPLWRRYAERLFRTALGVGPLYFFTVFLPHEIFPSGERQPRGKKAAQYQWDRVLVFSFFVVQLFVIGPSFVNLVFGLLIPQMTFHWLMGFATFLHHTHPKVPWYADRSEYSYHRSQVCSTVHVEFPWLIDVILHRILQHTAHHVDPQIPLYHLAEAQTALERQFGEIVHEPFTVRGFLNTLRTCRLYDYERHQWLDFDGSPTGDAIPLRSN
jgi:omega-6 fatty acid desaturase (delta-12 desaturase)